MFRWHRREARLLMLLSTGLLMQSASAERRQDNDKQLKKGEHMAKITGIGGVFFKSQKDPKALSEWYHKNLGMPVESWGGTIIRDGAEQSARGMGTAWKVTEKDSDLFSPSQSNFMINYRIDNMDDMVAQLKQNNVTITKGPECHENGKFLELLDLEGNKVTLWEPMVWDEKNKKP